MNVGIVGVGIMGSAIARNLIASGLVVEGYDIDPGRCRMIRDMGGVAAASAAELVGRSDIVLTSLPSVTALERTIDALVSMRRPGQIVIELGTFPIEVKERARVALAAAGIAVLDCPLSGTGAQAVTRDLAVYASGEWDAFERVRPLLDRFARVVHYLGAFGNGSKMKFVANLLVAIHNVASAEAMVLGVKAGLDPATICEVIRGGAGSSRIFELRAPMMAAHRYEPPTMKLEVWRKDLSAITAFAGEFGAATPMLDASVPIYERAVAAGLGGQDTAAVHAVLERMSGAVNRRG